MGTVIAFNREDDFQLGGSEETRMPAKKGKRPPKRLQAESPGGVTPMPQQLSLFEAIKESPLVQQIWDLLLVMWAKVLELEQKIIENFDRLAGADRHRQHELLIRKDWYTTTEYARITGLRRATVEKYLREGKLKGEKRPGRGGDDVGEYRISETERQRHARDGLLGINEKPRRLPPRRPR